MTVINLKSLSILPFDNFHLTLNFFVVSSRKVFSKFSNNMSQFKKLVSVFLLFVFSFSFLPYFQTVKAAWREPVRAKHAMVASQSKLAAEIGVDVMKKGGNA